MNYFQDESEKCFGDESRHVAGTCMIVFAIPLFIPGVTMTAVAFHDETGYSKYGAVHVLGMVLLGLAVIILIAGIILSIRFKSRVVPDKFHQVISTHEKIGVNINKNTDKLSKSIEYPNSNINQSSEFKPSIQHANYFIEKDYIATAADHAGNFFKGSHKVSDMQHNEYLEQSTSIRNHADDSSSCATSDSDDCTSGSYTITDDVVEGCLPLGVDFQYDVAEKQDQASKFKTRRTQEQKLSFRNLKTIVVRSPYTTLNNFFQDPAADNIADELKELHDNKNSPSVKSATSLDKQHKRKKRKMNLHEKDRETYPSQIHNLTNQTSEIQKSENRFSSRQRLPGFSSDSVSISPTETHISLENVLISSDTPVNSNITLPIESPAAHHVALPENVTDSNASVFSVIKETKSRTGKMDNEKKSHENVFEILNLTHRRSFSRSPYAARPFSYPDGHNRLESTSTTSVLQEFSVTTHTVRPNSSEGYSRCKTMASMTPSCHSISTPVYFVTL